MSIAIQKRNMANSAIASLQKNARPDDVMTQLRDRLAQLKKEDGTLMYPEGGMMMYYFTHHFIPKAHQMKNLDEYILSLLEVK